MNSHENKKIALNAHYILFLSSDKTTMWSANDTQTETQQQQKKYICGISSPDLSLLPLMTKP